MTALAVIFGLLVVLIGLAYSYGKKSKQVNTIKSQNKKQTQAIDNKRKANVDIENMSDPDIDDLI